MVTIKEHMVNMQTGKFKTYTITEQTIVYSFMYLSCLRQIVWILLDRSCSHEAAKITKLGVEFVIGCVIWFKDRDEQFKMAVEVLNAIDFFRRFFSLLELKLPVQIFSYFS